MIKEKEIVDVKTQLLNVDKIFVDLDTEDKMMWLGKALSEGKVFVMSKIGMKSLIGIKGEKDVLNEMYKFREEAVAFASNNSLDIDVFETYKDDAFCYDAKLIIRKKTIN